MINQLTLNGLIFAASFLNAVKIDNLLVPEVVHAGNAVVLDCLNSGTDEQRTVKWLFNGREVLDLTGRGLFAEKGLPSILPLNSTLLNINNTTSELSGDYTCVVNGQSGRVAKKTKSMLVYSTEKEFSANISRDKDVININCLAKGLFPQPELTIKVDREVILKQEQRVWMSDSFLYNAQSQAWVGGGGRCASRATCRLELPQAGYIAIREYFLPMDDSVCTFNKSTCLTSITSFFTIAYLFRILFCI